MLRSPLTRLLCDTPNPSSGTLSPHCGIVHVHPRSLARTSPMRIPSHSPRPCLPHTTRENSGDDDFFSSDIPLDDDEAKALGVSRGHAAMVMVRGRRSGLTTISASRCCSLRASLSLSRCVCSSSVRFPLPVVLLCPRFLIPHPLLRLVPALSRISRPAGPSFSLLVPLSSVAGLPSVRGLSVSLSATLPLTLYATFSGAVSHARSPSSIMIRPPFSPSLSLSSGSVSSFPFL
jgi:hypothetical protein